MRNRLIGMGLAIILLTNVVVLGNVYYNRSGSPDSQLNLSERELHQPWRGQSKEDSGMELVLNWRVIPRDEEDTTYTRHAMNGGSPVWLNQQKMQALGLTAPHSADEKRYVFAEKEVLLVLELDGAAYQQSVDLAQKNLAALTRNATTTGVQSGSVHEQSVRLLESAKRDLAEELTQSSRLFVVDAGLDETSLRAQYPDRQRYALVRGLVQQHRQYVEKSPTKMQVVGYIRQIHTADIHIPREFASAAQALHFTAQVAFGKKLEPWVMGMKAMP